MYPFFYHRFYFDWSWQRGSNPRPPDYKAGALPSELCQRAPPSFRGASSVAFGAIADDRTQVSDEPFVAALPTELHRHGAGIRNRTESLCCTKAPLCHLSYSSICEKRRRLPSLLIRDSVY